MFVKHPRCLALLAFLAFLAIAESVEAGTFGKVTGRVTDKTNNEGLAGATARLLGTSLGAVTDVDGNYYILNVTPGTYTLRISFVGFTAIDMREVRVVQDMTTEINVQLTQQTLELNEVVEVIARRPLVQKEVSGSAVTISSDDFRNRPIESIQSVINSSAGVVSFQGGTFIRGSRSTDVTYLVDGVPLTNPISGNLMTDVSKNAVEEVVLMKWGFSAEYGNAMGGVVNVTTKEGGASYSGALRYKTDKLTSGSQFYQNLNVLNLSVGGPVYEDIRFFIDGFLNSRDMNVQREVLAPDGTNLGRHPHEGYQEYRINGKLTVPLTETMKLKFAGSLNRSQQLLYNLYWRFGDDINQLDRYGALWNKTGYAAAILDHTLNAKTFYTVKLGYLDWHSINGQRDRNEWSGDAIGVNCDFWKDFTFRTPTLDLAYMIPGDPNVYRKWRLLDSQGFDDIRSLRTSDALSARNPYGVAGGIQNTVDAGYFQDFVRSGDRDYYEENRTRQFSLRADITTQPSANHEIKAGFEAVWHRVNRFRIGGMSSLNGVGVTYPVIDFYEKSPADTALTVTSASNLGDGYTPLELAAYGTYQLRLLGMYINFGLRYDYYNAQTEYRVNPLETTQSNPFKQTRVSSVSRSQFSPRLGISFPVTDRLVFRFNYGQFFQRPPMDRMFSYLWIDRNQADVDQGNPDIDPQKTIAYEVGLSAVLGEDWALGLTAFQKNMFHLEGYRLIRAPDLQWYFLAVNQEYAESYGVELTLRKRISEWTSGFINYTYSHARGTSSNVSQISRYPLTSTTYAKQLGYEPLYPQETMPMNYDRRHALNLVFNLSIPIDEGPEFLGFKPLSGIGVNLTGSLLSGTPYTPMTSYFVNVTTDRFNSAIFPTTYNLDARIHKDIRIAGITLSVFAEVMNLLDLNVPASVYQGSGNPDDPSYHVSKGSISSTSYAAGSPLYSARADLDLDGVLTPDERLSAYQRIESDMLALMENYSLPRRFIFGVELQF
ncbi:MAG: TonB-dependent receptor [Bacteroidetes bacterium]|nr:TonB-dependent receptor [Bacteroidota bacterium]